MTYSFRPSETSSATRQLLMALAGASGSGKTWSALELATGLAGDKRFAVIDTEAGRALHYRDFFKFDHCDMEPPFSPQAMGDVICEAASKYPVVIVDSMSMEYIGVGGLQDMQVAALEKLATNKDGVVDAWRMDAMTAPSWKGPKIAHKHMMARLTQCRSHIIFCLRAEPKIKFLKEKYTRANGSEGEKTVIVDAGFQPICEKMFMYEVLCSFMLYAENPGVGVPIKLQEQHKALFPDGQKIGKAAGQRLAAWSVGAPPPPKPPTEPTIAIPTDAAELLTLAESNAALGTDHLRQWFGKIGTVARTALKPHTNALRERAAAADGDPRI